MLIDEVDVRQHLQNDSDAHLEFLWTLRRLAQSDLGDSYAVAAIAASECGEWRSPRFVVTNR